MLKPKASAYGRPPVKSTRHAALDSLFGKK
jgi:hypothetical protein